MLSHIDPDLPVASAAIVMLSPPETQDGTQDVFHTPPEESSLRSSDNQQPTVTVDIGVVHGTLNKAVGPGSQLVIDSGEFPDELELADLGKDSGLGFSEADEKPVAGEISPASGGDGVGEIAEVPSDQFGISDAADAENPCNLEAAEADPQPRENVLNSEQMPEDEDCREISDDKDLSSGKKSETLAADLGTKTCDDDRDGYLSESSDEATEDSGKRGESDKEEPAVKRAASDELKSGREIKKCSGYDVLRVMAEKAHENEDVNNLLETARLVGISFPRPRWWPKNDDRFASGMFLIEETP